MQHNIYENSKLHILGIICLVTSLGLFFFSLYIVPFLIWQLDYDIPDFISNMIAYGEDEYYFSPITSKTLVWLIFFTPSIIMGYLSYYISNYIDKNYLEPQEKLLESMQEKSPSKPAGRGRDSTILGLKIILLMVLIVAIIFLLQILFDLTA
ncbi:hypothetical protein ACKOUJ_06990 [Legionella pneumophila]|uniref:Transmembrane protein n=1 Tax=Legionella pneumophila TaxID=446 RepID=A0AAN5PZS7_LEGPN|nr:hypothetical protein [Legionella pneumophila]HAT9090376.1 hypothetical protein [Legionella pneumophila subsp. pneumophila]TIH04676.1 hypothetical protein DI137_04910 [Legionella pneumophila]HAT3856388.1 hypothetical protein [Legionella pneumophila]HAT3859210.1 hypothetical protein [Legionella pneumophila]HAT3866084.1 hypothetical protein [Legionella pneumophila]